MLVAITYDFASPAAIEHAVNTAMAYYEREYAHFARPVAASTAELANVDARESELREQYKFGKLPPAVFTAWLAKLLNTLQCGVWQLISMGHAWI